MQKSRLYLPAKKMGAGHKGMAILSMTTREDLLQCGKKEARMIKEVAGHKGVEMGRSYPHCPPHG